MLLISVSPDEICVNFFISLSFIHSYMMRACSLSFKTLIVTCHLPSIPLPDLQVCLKCQRTSSRVYRATWGRWAWTASTKRFTTSTISWQSIKVSVIFVHRVMDECSSCLNSSGYGGWLRPPWLWFYRRFLPVKGEFFLPTVVKGLLIRGCLILGGTSLLHYFTVLT